MADEKKPEKTEQEKKAEEILADPNTSKLGKFIIKYHTFLSSFVIGVAGLIATSIWQYRQSETARRSAEAQQKVAQTQADNSWKIERAEILAKNLSVLAATGPNTVEQRYGVLLSLARGNILDPELAVSYALELGKDNPDYMASVLANTSGKDYVRLARAFVISCEEKYGLARNVDACAGDKMASRSEAIAELISDETQAAVSQGQPGPMVMLKDEREVQQNVQRLAALFEPTLNGYYERRLWNEVQRFANYSVGAHIVSSLVLAAARTGEFVTGEEQKKLDDFHDQQTQWLSSYIMGRSCDAECKGKILEVMISHYDESQGDYDAALKQLLEGAHALSGSAVSRLHARLLWCQVDTTDLFPLRDHVLVPATTEMLDKPKADPSVVADLVGLVALVPEPTPPTAKELAAGTPSGPVVGEKEVAAWKALMDKLDKPGSKLGRVFRDRRAVAQRERQQPPPAMRKVTFCSAPPPAAEE